MVELKPHRGLFRLQHDVGPGEGVEVTTGGAAIVGVAARRGCLAALQDAVRLRWSVELPTHPCFVEVAGGLLLWSGPGRWLLVAHRNDDGLEAELVQAFALHAAITAQGDGRVVFGVCGLRARDTLSKGVPIDLHPRSFAAGQTALTMVAHVDIQLWQIGAKHYELAIPRSYADSFLVWLMDAAAEHGCSFRPD